MVNLNIKLPDNFFEAEVKNGFLVSKERKELVIDWDLIRKVDAWGEGNIWLHENEKEIDKIFLGEIELYEDGRNFEP